MDNSLLIDKVINYYNNSDDVSAYNKTILDVFNKLNIRLGELVDLKLNDYDESNHTFNIKSSKGILIQHSIDDDTAKQLDYYIHNIRNKWNINNLDNLFINRFGKELSDAYVSIMIKMIFNKIRKKEI